MSYSISFKVKSDKNKNDVALKLQEEIDNEYNVLIKKGVNIEKFSVFSDDIPYAPNVKNLIGVQIHSMDEVSMTYLYHKIISFAKEYGELKTNTKLENDKTPYPFFYYDDEITFVVPNEKYDEIMENIKNRSLNITYEDRFSKPKILETKNTMRALLNIFIDKEKKKMSKILKV